MRVAVFGQGSAGRRHAQILLDDGHEVVACDPEKEPLDGVEAREEQRILDGADAAVIASPSWLHARQANACLRFGVATLVEKPLAMTASEAERLGRVARDNDVLLAVAMNLRCHPELMKLKERMPSVERVYRIDAYCGSYLPDWHPNSDHRLSYSSHAGAGGGVLLDVAVHELDYISWLMGAAPRAVASMVGNCSWGMTQDSEDSAVIGLKFPGGEWGVVTADYLDRERNRGYRIVGSNMTLSGELPPDDGCYVEQMQRFVAATESGTISARRFGLASADEAADVLTIINAAEGMASKR